MEVNTISDKEFVKCVNNGDYSTVKKQLKLGADPNIYDEEGNPLLFLPIINGDDEMMDILLSFGKYWPYLYLYMLILLLEKSPIVFLDDLKKKLDLPLLWPVSKLNSYI